jgi:hypothetical protein
MAGTPWTEKEVDLEFMLAYLPEFAALHSKSEKRKKSQPKEAFLERLYLKYTDTFPGRCDTWKLSEIGTGGTEAERKARIKKVSDTKLTVTHKLTGPQRFRDWFTNRLQSNAGNGGKRKDTVLDLCKTKGSRREAAYHTYFRLEGHRLQESVKNDYLQYKAECDAAGIKPMHPTARRNQFLSKSLKAEPKELQDKIEEARIDAGENGAGRKFASISEVTNATNDEKRMECAQKLQWYVRIERILTYSPH